MSRRIAVVGILVGLIVLLVGAHFQRREGLGGCFFRAGLGLDTTVYARSYSDAAFRQVSVGMTTEQVLKFLGEPLDTYTMGHRPDVTGMRWSKTPCDGSYEVRVILFDKGKVIKRISEYYVD
jgi:hypothetical protein